MLARLAKTRCVVETGKAHSRESRAPLGDRLPTYLMAFGNVLALAPLGAIQDDAGATVKRHFGTCLPAPLLKGLSLVFVQYDRGGYASHLMLLVSRYVPG